MSDEAELIDKAEEFRAYPKSVQPGIPTLGDAPKGWRVLPMGKLLKVVQRPVKMVDDDLYQLVTARRNRGGLVARERLTGAKIATKTQFRVKAGDFVMSRRQIAHGACGILPPKLDDALVSNEYAALLPTDELDKAFLRHLPHSIYFQQTCFHSSVGVHVEKLVFNLDHWLTWPFLIPPAGEQRRIATVLDAWNTAIAVAERLVIAQQRRWSGLIQHFILESSAPRSELSNFAELVKDKVAVTEALFDQSIELDNVESGTGRLLSLTAADALSGQRAAFRAEDTLFGKLRPYLRKTYFAKEDGMASTEMWVLRADPDRCLPHYLYYLIRSPIFEAEANRPTGSRMPRADWEWVAKTPLPLPGVNEQGRIVSVLLAADEDVNDGRELLERLRVQKRGLMQQLLTGKLRVPDSIDALLPPAPKLVVAA